jgi:hypothetical protein
LCIAQDLKKETFYKSKENEDAKSFSLNLIFNISKIPTAGSWISAIMSSNGFLITQLCWVLRAQFLSTCTQGPFWPCKGISVFKGTYYRQVKLVQATELDLAVANEKVNALETKIELLNLKLQVAVADSERWKRRYQEMSDRSYASINSNRNTSQKLVKIAATSAKWSAATTKSTAPKKDSGDWLSPLR